MRTLQFKNSEIPIYLVRTGVVVLYTDEDNMDCYGHIDGFAEEWEDDIHILRVMVDFGTNGQCIMDATDLTWLWAN